MPDAPPLRIFLDTNIILRSAISSAPEYERVRSALDILDEISAELWISRQVLREYAMNVTRPQNYMEPLTHQQAAARVRVFIKKFNVADETQAVSDQWTRLLETIPMGGRQVHDANIAATMITYNIPALLTLNAVDFVRFEPQIRVLSLADVEAMKPTNETNEPLN
jgi:predicted nucleic acid-binding protein